MNSDGDKLYTTFVAIDEIYNFIVRNFLFEVILGLKQLIYCPDLDTENWDLDNISFFEPQDDFKWKMLGLQSCRSRRNLQVPYKVYLHRSSYKKLRFLKIDWP
jgi:hypothetical protein